MKTIRQKIASCTPLFLAPMDGISDPVFRQAVMNLYGGWDYLVTEFLRVPTKSFYKTSFIDEFIGVHDTTEKEHTIVQILTTELSETAETVRQIIDLGFNWIDLNLGCPSNTVNRHKGGAYLLTDPLALACIVRTMRESIPTTNIFSIKMRVGYRDDQQLKTLLHILENEGVDLIFLHARTKEDGYHNKANWDYLTQAKSLTSLPLIGNGDIWEVAQIDEMINRTGVDGVMLGRGAFRTPWIAQFWKEGKSGKTDLSLPNLSLKEHIQKFISFLTYLEKKYRLTGKEDHFILCRWKALSLYLFSNWGKDSEEMNFKKNLLRSKNLSDFINYLDRLDQLA